MTLQEVVKATLTKMKNDSISLTPVNYQTQFCLIAKKNGLILPECNRLEQYMAKLNKELLKEVQEYKPRNTDELFAFITAKINRLNPTMSSDMVKQMGLLVKRMAQVAASLHNKEVTELSDFTLEQVDTLQDVKSIELLKKQWMDFLTSYEDVFLDRLNVFGPVDKDDLRKTVHNAVDSFSSSEGSYIPEDLPQIIIEALTPSIASSMDDDIAAISSQLRDNGHVLDTQGMQDDLKMAIAKRIELDKAALKETVYQLDEIAGEVSNRLISIIEQSESKKSELKDIKEQLETIDIKDRNSHIDLHKRLLDIATILEAETSSLNHSFKVQQAKISTMDQKIVLLESELDKANTVSREDHLTKLHNKRALDEKLVELDALFRRKKRDFAILFFDIDHFKNVNDTYGHEAGDAVLATFAKVLLKESRDSDFTARFGGEEFVMILPETTVEDGVAFANKIRKKIEKSSFVFKGQKMKLTVSGGVAIRSHYDSSMKTVEKADAQLYRAKTNGRNVIYPC